MLPHPSQASGVVFPRYRQIAGSKIVQADRIESAEGTLLRLESGARVTVEQSVLDSGPSNIGDFLMVDGDKDELVRGDEFEAMYQRIHHGLDIPAVSAGLDPTAGSVNKPVNAADPAHPATPNQVAVEPPAGAEVITQDMELAAKQKEAETEKSLVESRAKEQDAEKAKAEAEQKVADDKAAADKAKADKAAAVEKAKADAAAEKAKAAGEG